MIQIVAYQPEIAPNLGNMIRTAACFDVPIGVINPCGFPFSAKALKRSAMDYADQADIRSYDDWNDFCGKFEGRKLLLTTKSTQAYTDFKFETGDAIIFGQESAGVPKSVADACDACLTIPMRGGTRSLNLSVSAAIVAAEALRQLGAL